MFDADNEVKKIRMHKFFGPTANSFGENRSLPCAKCGKKTPDYLDTIDGAGNLQEEIDDLCVSCMAKRPWPHSE